MSKTQYFKLLLVLLGCLINYLHCHDLPCDFNAMCLCWVQDDSDFTKMDISCTGVPFARFPGNYFILSLTIVSKIYF